MCVPILVNWGGGLSYANSSNTPTCKCPTPIHKLNTLKILRYVYIQHQPRAAYSPPTYTLVCVIHPPFLNLLGCNIRNYRRWVDIFNHISCWDCGALHESTAERREAGREEDRLVSVVSETTILPGELWGMVHDV
jgi:hypothetical protein